MHYFLKANKVPQDGH